MNNYYKCELTKDEKSVLETSLTAYLNLLEGNIFNMFNYLNSTDLKEKGQYLKDKWNTISDIIREENKSGIRKESIGTIKACLKQIHYGNELTFSRSELLEIKDALDSYMRFYMGDFMGALMNIEELGSVVTHSDNEELIHELKKEIYDFSPNSSYGIFSINVPRVAKIGYQLVQAINNCGAFPFSEKSYITATGDKEPIIYWVNSIGVPNDGRSESNEISK